MLFQICLCQLYFQLLKLWLNIAQTTEDEYKKKASFCFCEQLNASEFLRALLKNAFELGVGMKFAKDCK